MEKRGKLEWFEKGLFIFFSTISGVLIFLGLISRVASLYVPGTIFLLLSIWYCYFFSVKVYENGIWFRGVFTAWSDLKIVSRNGVEPTKIRIENKAISLLWDPESNDKNAFYKVVSKHVNLER